MRHHLLTLAAVGALLAPLTLHAPEALAATPAVGVASESTARVIVKFKTNASVLRRQAQSAAGPAAAAQVLADRAQSLGQRTGLALKSGAAVSDRMQVVFAKGMSSAQLASRLAKEADVEYAVVDQRRRRFAVPNDPLYGAVAGSGPASGQWYLKPPSVATPSGIDAEGAWDITTGTSSVVVAVLDTGVRFDHPDLVGKLHAGYDFISDVPTANDGNGRDADASDPGDWVTQAEVDQPGGAFEDCEVEDSSWHGTQVAGIVGAATNNGIGMASVGRNVMVLPVRVLGKCGGFDSDIIAGMRWAAGLTVSGIPDNPNPARVINMSLGGDGLCDASNGYRDAVAALAAEGALVVASAGNSAGHAVALPANCAGAVGVGGLRHVGAKVGFSDLGPQITVSAPGGNCVNIGLNDACLFPILTTSNAGVTAPVAGGIYTDSYNISVGTSFSAPLVAGTAALMFSANPALTPKNVELLLASTARPFPTTGGDNGDGTPVLECTAPQFDGGSAAVDQLQCYCSTGTCGGGMLDARAAVQAASTGVAAGVRARIDISPQQPVALQSVQLRGGNSVLAAGRSIATYQWALVDGGGIVSSISNATAAVATVVPTAAGRFKVRLTVVDSANAMSTADLTMVVNPDPTPPAPPPPPPSTGGGGGGALGFEWLAMLAAAVWTLRRSGRAAA
ncbi:serine protease [Burkholderiaceae bacterium]|nr:serine protease [Burkholderiaceae bacterium]